MKHLRSLSALLGCSAAILLGSAVCAQNSELSDSEWNTLKQKALARPRPLVVNHDGCDVTAWPKSFGEFTVEKFYDYMLNNFIGSKVSTFTYCPFGVGLAVSVPTKVGEQCFADMGSPFFNATQKLQELTGKDAMQLSLEFARQHGMEFFAAMRVNDVHDMHFPGILSQYKKDHPELLIGSDDNRPYRGEWTAFDYARPEVCDRLVAVVTELMENYDVDGLELDFCRMTCYFKSVAWNQPVSQAEMDMMTGAIRRIRANAERIGRARKHPIVILFHLIDSPEVCREMGLDVERWMQEGLFDIYAGGSDRGNYNLYGDLAAVCRKYNITYLGGVLDPYSFTGVFDRRTTMAYDGLQAAQLAAGAEGVYAFNLHYAKPMIQHFVTSLDDLKFFNKSYFVAHQHENNYGVQPDSYKKFNKVPELTPWREFLGAVKKDYIIQVGDDFTDPAIASLPPEEQPAIKLYLQINAPADKLKVQLNGTTLTPEAGAQNGNIAVYPVAASIVKRGVNNLTLDGTAAANSMSGHRRLFGENATMNAGGRPWWSIWLSGPGTKGVAEGGSYLNDNLSGECGMVNQICTLSGLGGVPTRLEFDLKTKESNDPETSVLRFADGRNIEIIDFQPHQIVLKYAKKSAKFDTFDSYHRYKVSTKNGKLSLQADNRYLFRDVPLPMPVDTPETWLHHHKYLIPADSNLESIVLGSLNGPGKGYSVWKNFDFYTDMIVSDAVLTVTFPPQIPAAIKEVMPKLKEWSFEADFSNGKVPELPALNNGYKKLSAAPQNGGVLIDNEIDGNIDAGMFLTLPEVSNSQSRFRYAEWVVTPVRASKTAAGHSTFQMVFRPGKDAKKLLNAAVELNNESITTPWGGLLAPAGALHFLMVVDMQEESGVLILNGKTVGSGKLEVRNETPALMWGDLSGSTGGAVTLKMVRFGAYPSLKSSFAAAESKIKNWNVTLDYTSGQIPAAEGVTSTYEGTNPAEGGQGIVLDNEIGTNPGMGFFYKNAELVQGASRYRAVEWQVMPLRDAAEHPEFSVFQMVFRTGRSDKAFLNMYLECNRTTLRTPWGTFPAPKGMATYRMVVDHQEKTGVLYVNGKAILSCPLEEQPEPPCVIWGDLSGGVGGAAVLKSVRFAYWD